MIVHRFNAFYFLRRISVNFWFFHLIFKGLLSFVFVGIIVTSYTSTEFRTFHNFVETSLFRYCCILEHLQINEKISHFQRLTREKPGPSMHTRWCNEEASVCTVDKSSWSRDKQMYPKVVGCPTSPSTWRTVTGLVKMLFTLSEFIGSKHFLSVNFPYLN
jgi:hypothetical protein